MTEFNWLFEYDVYYSEVAQKLITWARIIHTEDRIKAVKLLRKAEELERRWRANNNRCTPSARDQKKKPYYSYVYWMEELK